MLQSLDGLDWTGFSLQFHKERHGTRNTGDIKSRGVCFLISTSVTTLKSPVCRVYRGLLAECDHNYFVINYSLLLINESPENKYCYVFTTFE